MPRYVVFCNVHHDGVGDFSHFEDIMIALLANPAFNDVEFIPIVYFDDAGKESNYVRIGEKMKSFGIPFFYGKTSEHAHFSSDEVVQKLLNEADQAIIISYGKVPNFYKPFLKKDIPVKFIYEHENWGNGTRSLGLSRSCYGIKIKDVPQIQPLEAWSIIEKNDPEFAAQLLKCTHSPDFKTFNNTHIVIPAYFNNDWSFISLLDLLGINTFFPKDKNIVIYHSGTDFRNSLQSNNRRIQAANLNSLFEKSCIKNIEVINPQNNPSSIIINGNQQQSQTIKILTGFYISDPALNALYHLSTMAGVSGDNSFERCISMDILPYYWSTNGHNKRATLDRLKEITQLDELNISPEARKSFAIFFDIHEYLSHQDELHDDTNPDNFTHINILKMIEDWPIVTDYLKKNMNFYDKLESIVLENLPLSALPTTTVLKKIQEPASVQVPIQTFFQPTKESAVAMPKNEPEGNQNKL